MIATGSWLLALGRKPLTPEAKRRADCAKDLPRV